MAVYFTDRDLAKRFPLELANAGISVVRHQDYFADDEPDDVWIPEVARRGWVAVTHNRRIRYVPNELAAVFESRLALLVLVGQASTLELANNFIRTISKIDRFVARHDPPYIAKVFRPSPRDIKSNATAPGRIEMWLDEYPQKK